MIILIFIFVGLITGILAGLLGIGGGIITVPAMFYILHQYHSEHLMQVCVATALATTLLTSIGSTLSHHKKKTILPSILKILIPGLVSGSILGGVLSSYFSDKTLQIFFGTISILFAIYFFFPKLPQLKIAKGPNKSLFLFGILVGSLSSLLGVGGGIFLVPILLGYHVSLQNTVACSSAGTLATAFVGTVIYLFLSEGKVTMPGTVGFIHVPAFLAMGISSLCTTSLGCKLSHTLPQVTTKRVFSLVLCFTGLSMIFLK